MRCRTSSCHKTFGCFLLAKSLDSLSSCMVSVMIKQILLQSGYSKCICLRPYKCSFVSSLSLDLLNFVFLIKLTIRYSIN